MSIKTWLRKLVNTPRVELEKELLRAEITELLRDTTANIEHGQRIVMLEKKIKDNRWLEAKARDEKDFAKAKAINHDCFQLRERLASARNDEMATRRRSAEKLHVVLNKIVDGML